MRKRLKVLSCVLAASLFLSTTSNAFASSETTNYSQNEQGKVVVSDDGITINGVFYTPDQFDALLNTAEEISEPEMPLTRSPILLAGTYFVPGVGEVMIMATGVVIVGGVTIAAGSWAYKKIVSYFKEHRTHKTKKNHDKHTKLRPGRGSEKKKQKDSWKRRR